MIDQDTIAENKATSFITVKAGKVRCIKDTQIEIVKGKLKKNFEFLRNNLLTSDAILGVLVYSLPFYTIPPPF